MNMNMNLTASLHIGRKCPMKPTSQMGGGYRSGNSNECVARRDCHEGKDSTVSTLSLALSRLALCSAARGGRL